MFHAIQACRAVAALLVVLSHAAWTTGSPKYFGALGQGLGDAWAAAGPAGVAFFFVLSGFIISHVHRNDIGRPQRLGHYLRRRALRIYPPYLAVFLAAWLVGLSVASIRPDMPTDPVVVLKSLLLLPQDRAVLGGNGAPVIIVAWTLQYEVMFYTAFAAGIVARWLHPLLWLAYAAAFAANLATGMDRFPLDFVASPYVLLFGMGALSARAVAGTLRPPAPARLALLAAAGFVAIGLAQDVWRDRVAESWLSLGYGVFSAVLVFALVRWETGRAGTRMKPAVPAVLMRLGDASYSIYLVHFPALSVIYKVLARVLPHSLPGTYAAWLLAAAMATGAGVLFHRVVERPLLRGATRLLTPAAAGAA